MQFAQPSIPGQDVCFVESGKRTLKLPIENMPDAFAYHQVILDDYRFPLDYIFLDIDLVYEEITKLKREMIIGKKVAEIRAEFQKCAGYHFDPALVAHFLTILDCKGGTVGL